MFDHPHARIWLALAPLVAAAMALAGGAHASAIGLSLRSEVRLDVGTTPGSANAWAPSLLLDGDDVVSLWWDNRSSSDYSLRVGSLSPVTG